MKFFIYWALSGLLPILSFILYSQNTIWFQYNSFLVIFMCWIIMGVFALIDLIKGNVKEEKDEVKG